MKITQFEMSNENQPSVLVYEASPQKKGSLYTLLESQQVNLIPIATLEALKFADFARCPEVIVMDLSQHPDDKVEACKRILRTESLNRAKLLLVKPELMPALSFIPEHRLAGYVSTPIFTGELYGKLHTLLYEVYMNLVG